MLFKKKRKNSKEFNERFKKNVKKKFFTKTSVLAWIFAAILLIGMIYAYVNTERKIQAYQESIDELSIEIKELEKTNRDLEEQMENVDSDEYIERIARERLGMVKDGEIVLKQSNNDEVDSSSGSGNKTESKNKKDSKTEKKTDKKDSKTEKKTDKKDTKSEKTTAKKSTESTKKKK